MEQDSLTLPCPHCGAQNRVPRARLGHDPSCTGCDESLLGGSPVAMTPATLEMFTSRSDLPVLLVYWAPQCGPCLELMYHLGPVVGPLAVEVRCAKVDTERYPQLAARFHITSIPTLLLLQHGSELGRRCGVMQSGEITGWVRKILRSKSARVRDSQA